MKLAEKWTRAKAREICDIISRLDLCGCGSDTDWEYIKGLLAEAEKHTENGFYCDPATEFAAKVLDSKGLLEHGTGIGFAWLTYDGALLLEFLRDFGVDSFDANDGSGHPLWATEYSWSTDADAGDTYEEWASSQAAKKRTAQ